ncbi:hypothetical protein F4604DRAFT_1931480 [Suillus subluteus]|nr:hypothetical protein F4604DRAFT_1942145 [Suillus subluteus]KAG1837614.1 hypothetical protein F4604DRAFT_1942146 [Suillus subluteus]KAG1857524.1 hypothetical protein F4604DRAFT_1931480 [Suillus subluteus]
MDIGDASDLDHLPLEFKGDFFGMYAEDELEWPDDGGAMGDVPTDEEDLGDDDAHDEWEPPLVPLAHNPHEGDDEDNDIWDQHPPDAQDPHYGVEEHLCEHEDAPILIGSGPNNVYAPFTSKLDWEMARWAKLRGPSSTAFSELVSIEGLSDTLGLSFKNTRELNKIIDNELPGRPKFKSLFGDLNFADFLVFAPERHYADEDETVRLYHEMNTGKWWWNTQKCLDCECPGATIIPVIILSDKTQVTLFHNKTAYPVYMTIGNIPKEICRKPSHHAHVLLAYLPTTCLEHVTNKASCRHMLANLYHACVGRVLAPLATAGIDGVNMRSGNGALAGAANYQPQNLDAVLDALSVLDEGGLAFIRACTEAGIKPIVHPYWEGLVKHLLAWLSEACGSAEIDAQCCRLPPNHHIRHFMKGITTLSCLSGTEHSQICRFLLGIIIDIRLQNNMSSLWLLRAVRGLLDFLYLAQYPCHSSETLALLDEALNIFHDNKEIFVDLGIRNSFNLPKLHFALHYSHMIRMYGTTDNYNTEYTERLHIDLAKDAYRSTNHKNEFAQMTTWLERREKNSTMRNTYSGDLRVLRITYTIILDLQRCRFIVLRQ